MKYTVGKDITTEFWEAQVLYKTPSFSQEANKSMTAIILLIYKKSDW